jgi:hypothetical protein
VVEGHPLPKGADRIGGPADRCVEIVAGPLALALEDREEQAVLRPEVPVERAGRQSGRSRYTASIIIDRASSGR